MGGGETPAEDAPETSDEDADPEEEEEEETLDLPFQVKDNQNETFSILDMDNNVILENISGAQASFVINKAKADAEYEPFLEDFDGFEEASED
jgi:hypothetical protein